MDLLEYQAKELFSQVGIPVLPSQSIADPSELKNLHIHYPIVLKSQVLVSGRAKFGGVRFVENTIDAIAVAQSLFNLSIEGEYPKVILAESRYDVENEIFLGIMFDYVLKKPVLMGSSQGGINVEILLDNLQTCVIEEEFLPFHARHLVMKMNLKKKAIAPVTAIIEKMYDLFIQNDLDIIEINPLGVKNNGEVMALDGKIRINDDSLNRHPNLLKYLNKDQFLSTVYSCLEINNKSDIVIISDSIDEAIFILNHLEGKNIFTQKLYVLTHKNQQFWTSNINQVFRQIIENTSEKKIIITHSNQDNFVDALIEEIKKSHQEEINYKELISQDREERPTGTRLWNETPKSKQKTNNLYRYIQWSIRTFSPHLLSEQESLNLLPIKIDNNLDKILQIILKD
ncbi:ATP-grasp domain-containing protein [Cyanobacterium aponinum]|uniref:ATP-grasp domain-containing protein n=1 Tax=Cyanobacterium aponinum TaxID=379064 RepID=UPI000C12A8EC|nr:ATP-grasp domain-containing protein [Cyanobacterium aponinum]PHV62751.1 succinate--CoA ligase [Cyanobacterium aponinum IPPAS B-1201]